MWNDPNIVKVIKEGGVVVMPTDTVYGIVASAQNGRAIERLYEIKNRQKDKKLINLIFDWSETKGWGIDSSKFNIPLYDSPTTFVLGETSFRVPLNNELKELLKKTGPLVAPSANTEGLPPAKNITEAKNYFGDKVDLYVDGGEIVGNASKIIKLNEGGTVTVLPIEFNFLSGIIQNMSNHHISLLQVLFGDIENTRDRKKILRSIKAKADAKRTLSEKIADRMTSQFGTMTFLIANVILFIVWLLINTNEVTSIAPFDPFPFNLLTSIVSLEAIILAVFVLISQNRTAKVDDLREETHLQLNLISEREITKIMKMLVLLLAKEGIDVSQDPELKKMLRPVSEEEIERRLEKEIL